MRVPCVCLCPRPASPCETDLLHSETLRVSRDRGAMMTARFISVLQHAHSSAASVQFQVGTRRKTVLLFFFFFFLCVRARPLTAGACRRQLSTYAPVSQGKESSSEKREKKNEKKKRAVRPVSKPAGVRGLWHAWCMCVLRGGVSSSLFVSLSGVCVRRLSFVAKGKTK